MTPQPKPRDPLDEWSDRDYPVAEDMRFQRITWIVERIGWAAVVGLMLLALAGLFSMGPLSAVEQTDDSGALTVRYDRFQRSGATAVMEVVLTPLDGEGAALHFDKSFLHAFTIEAVQPRPAEWRGEADGAALVFPVPDGRSFTVQLSLRPETVGSLRSRLRLGGQSAVDLFFFVYP